MPRLLSVVSMVAPLLMLVGCSSNVAKGRYLGMTTAPVPPLPVYGTHMRPDDVARYDATGSAAISRSPTLEVSRLSALHPTLPVPSLVEVTNLDNECSILVRVVGRGAASTDLIIELSPAAAKLLRIRGRGDVRVTYQQPAPLDGTDAAEQTHMARYPGLGCTR